MPNYSNYNLDETILMSYPQWLHMTDMTVDETAPFWLWISVQNPDDHAKIDKIYNAF